MTTYPIIKIKAGREWQLKRGHPWLFSGGIAETPKGLGPGQLIELQDATGQFVARGYYNPKTDIAVRVLTRQPEEINADFLRRRVQQAYELRRNNLEAERTDVYRLINAEGDFLPGVIVDSYAGVLVLQCHTAGADRLLKPLTQALEEVVQPRAILLRNDVSVRAREGLAKEEPRLLSGEIPAELVVKENGLRFSVDPWKGQKTGFFTDQRDKRQALAKYVAGLKGEKPSLLNCFSYTAGFSVYATHARSDLLTVNVDQSASALQTARHNFELNDLDPAQHRFEATDAFKWLETEREAGQQYDVVILDPPAFAKTHREKDKALQGYVRLNRLGLPLVKPGGYLLTCSCSGSVGLDDFQECLREAGAHIDRSLQVLEVFENSPDHPFNLAAPEGRYLKVLFCRVN